MLPQGYLSPRRRLLGPKELFLFFVSHFAHFNRRRKARQNIRQFFCIARGFWAGGGGEQRAAADGWYPHQSPSTGWMATAWLDQQRTYMPAPSPTGHEVSGWGSQRSAVHFHKGFWGLEMCFHSGVEQEPNFSNASPKWISFLVLLPLEHLFSDWDDQGSHLDPSLLINWPQKLWKLSRGNVINGTIPLQDVLVWMKQHFPTTMTTNLIKMFEWLQSPKAPSSFSSIFASCSIKHATTK